jgi:hypothetical protein
MKRSIEVLCAASSALARIRNDPMAKKALAIKREKPLLKPGRTEWSKPRTTPKTPTATGINGLDPKLTGPKKNMPTPTKPTAAPTEKPVHVAQRTRLSAAKTCAENLPQAGWWPRKLEPSHAFEAF